MQKYVATGVSASAGAKVMITGGYLVLEQPNNALVVSVDARMRTSVFPLFKVKKELEKTQAGVKIPLVISTPQRCREALQLELIVSPMGDLGLAGKHVDENKFISITLKHSLQAIYYAMGDHSTFLSKLQNGLLIHVRGDRTFYSSQPATNINTALPDGIPTEVEVDGVAVKVVPDEMDDPAEYTNKTGLGSSAALVSSLVASLFAHFGLIYATPNQANTEEKSNEILCHRYGALQTLAYRVAQFAHCDAQGKVGSGFDIAVAFYGTQVYTRFSPKILAPLLGRDKIPMSEFVDVLARDIQPYLFPAAETATHSNTLKARVWDDITATFKFPPGFRMLLGDVHGGSETPGMVKKILSWKASDSSTVDSAPSLDDSIPETPQALWSSLAAGNTVIAHTLENLERASVANPEVYELVVKECASKPLNMWEECSTSSQQELEIRNLFVKLRQDFIKVRQRLQAMGEAAGVPVEPGSQTKLLDTIMQEGDDGAPGVLMAGVPGAGGFDAVFVIILDPNELSCDKGVAKKESCLAEQHVLKVWEEADSITGTKVNQLPVDIDVGGIKCLPTARVFNLQCIIPEEPSCKPTESACILSKPFIRNAAIAAAALILLKFLRNKLR